MTKDSRRLLSLDVLRGITVAGMILVNDGYGESFTMLKHSKWNGMTPCDLVFPFFLFIMGISTYLSLRKYEFKANREVIWKILRRTLLIFLIGLFINYFDKAINGNWWPMDTIRIMGVMQRIALCYCAVSFIALTVNHKYLLHIVFGLLIVYALILSFGNGYAEDATNIAARIDKAIFGYDHLYHKSPVDPEGLLGTLSAIAHTLLGFFACKMMREAKDIQGKVLFFLLFGAILVISGYLLSYSMPLNKRIWSPSYVLVTCGLCSLLQGIIMYWLDYRQNKQNGLVTFFLVFGINPLFLYVLSELLAIIFGHFDISTMIYSPIHSIVTHPQWASFCYALTFTLICGTCGYPLYKKKIYIKI
ncbi:MAG: DUF1624 domain-containing protein [Prevotella sp.]|nr:DUF1624 domain-containing protein [Prevotella sp.]